MIKNEYLGFRASEMERQRLRELAKITGQSMSEVFRQLVMNAQLEETKKILPMSKVFVAQAAFTNE